MGEARADVLGCSVCRGAVGDDHGVRDRLPLQMLETPFGEFPALMGGDDDVDRASSWPERCSDSLAA